MPVTPQNHLHKAPDIQTVKFEGDPDEVLSWVQNQLPEGWTAQLVNYNRTISVNGPTSAWSVNRSEYIAKDSNGKLFPMSEELLTALYDPTP